MAEAIRSQSSRNAARERVPCCQGRGRRPATKSRDNRAYGDVREVTVADPEDY